MQSMTGFGSREAQVGQFGKICVELRSANHKFLDIAFHLPEGFLSLEEKIKKEIEAKIKRGRIACVINIIGKKALSVSVNRPLVGKYLFEIKNLKRHYGIHGEIGIDTLIHLPGVVSLEENGLPRESLWPRLKTLINACLAGLLKSRLKEGLALQKLLRKRIEALRVNTASIKTGFKKALKNKLSKLKTDEERAAFLKSTDITEELERLVFHLGNFKNRLSKGGPVGKELDFIAQEMQREANTLAAKSFDVFVSAMVIQAKSNIEKIREQVQNIE